MFAFYQRIRRRLSLREALRKGLIVADERVTFGREFTASFAGDRKGQLTVGRESHVDGRFVIRGDGCIRVGANCSFRAGSYFGAVVLIEMGSSVFGAENVFVIDNNNHPTSPAKRREMTQAPMGSPSWRWTAEGVGRAPVHIEDNVWLGRDAVVLKGVRVGTGSIVALGAIVASSVPARSVVAGNPARVVKTLAED